MADYQARPYEDEDRWQHGLSVLPTTAGQVFGAQWDDTWTGNISPLAYRAIERRQTNAPELWEPEVDAMGNVTGHGQWVKNEGYVPSPMLDPDEANKRFGIQYQGKRMLNWDQPVSEREAEELHRLKVQELQRQSIIQRGPQGFFMGAGKLAVGLGASVIDPINLLSALIPVVGEARYGALLAEAGTSMFARAGVRAGVGAVEGMVGQAILEPGVYALSKAEQRDYTFADSLNNILIGGMFGGGLHVAGGLAKDRLFGISKIIDDAPLETRRAMVGEAMVAVMEGRPVRADLVLREHLLGGTYKTTPLDMARAQFELPSARLVPEMTARARDPQTVSIDMGGGVRIELPTPHPSPDPARVSLPMLARNGEAMTFAGRKTADNAANRVFRDQGFRPEILETSEGFILRRESNIEPTRSRDGTGMTFENERQATRYRDQILRDPNLDLMPVSTGGPVRYALVAGATPADIAAARKAPGNVDLRVVRDVPTMIEASAREIEARRDEFLRDVSQYVQDKLTPTVRQTEADVKMQADANTDHLKAVSIKQTIDRNGGTTEASILERELKELDDQIKAVNAVGELDDTSKALLKEGQDLIASAEQRASVWDRIAGCLR